MILKNSVSILATLTLNTSFLTFEVKADELITNAMCLLIIDDIIHMNSICRFDFDGPESSISGYFSDEQLVTICPDGRTTNNPLTSCSSAEEKVIKPGIFGLIFYDSGSLCWNERHYIKAHKCFEGLNFIDDCWSNPKATDRHTNKVYSVTFCSHYL
jgi:hypothetical protein